MLRRLALVALLAGLSAHADYMDHFVVRDDVGIHKAPYLGPAELLIIPLEVSSYPRIDYEKLYGFFTSDAPDGFLAYMKTASLGRYQPRVTITATVNYLNCPLPAAQFPNCTVARGDIAAFSAGMELIRDAVRRADTESGGFDFSALDVNGRRGVPDGWVDGVMILTNVPFGGIAFPFGYYNRGDNLAGGTGGPLIVDGVKIGHVAIAGYDDVYTMVHEFGHLQGLTDLYAENQTYPGLQFSVMGTWGYDPKLPLHDAETRLRLRWASWHQVQGRQRVVIQPSETSGEVWRLGTGAEYFLVENRGPGQFDQAFTARGLAVYHVDRSGLRGEEGRFQDRLFECVNCDKWRPFIMNVQADGRFELQTDAQAQPSYEDDLFRDGDSLGEDQSGVPLSEAHSVASTNWYSGMPSGISISGIQVMDDGTIIATLEAPNSGQCSETLCPEGEGCFPVTCEDPGDSRAPGCACSGSPGLLLGALGLLLLEQRLRRREQRVFRGA